MGKLGQTTREKDARRNTRTIVIATQGHRDEDGKKVQNCYEDDDQCVRMGGARAARLASRMRINIMFLMTNGENDIAHGGVGEVIICNDDDCGCHWILIIRRLRAREILYILSSRSSGHG